MAINMLNEDSIVKCPNCKSNLLFLNKVFTLEKIQTNEGLKYKKNLYKAQWTCVKCKTEIPVKDKDVLNT